jgi:hypothetical protein
MHDASMGQDKMIAIQLPTPKVACRGTPNRKLPAAASQCGYEVLEGCLPWHPQTVPQAHQCVQTRDGFRNCCAFDWVYPDF